MHCTLTSMDKLPTDSFTHTRIYSHSTERCSLSDCYDLWYECLYFLDKNDVCIWFFRCYFNALTHKNGDRTVYISGSLILKQVCGLTECGKSN